jgi:hypothetical protein
MKLQMSVLMNVHKIHCHATGLTNVMLVLQSCTDPRQVLPGSSSETVPTPSDGACNFSNTEVEVGIGVEDVIVIEERREEAAVPIKQDEIPGNITFLDIKTEPDEVSYVCVCLLLATFFCVQIRQSFCNNSVSGQLKQHHCWE